MTLIYRAYKAGLTVNYKPRRGTYCKLAKMIVEDVVKRIAKTWCGGWDLNPRRPAPSGPEPDPFDLARAPPHAWGSGLWWFWVWL